jgi:hypothetical protein
LKKYTALGLQLPDPDQDLETLWVDPWSDDGKQGEETELDKAAARYTASFAQYPGFYTAVVKMGQLYADQTKWQSGFPYFRMAIQMKPKSLEVLCPSSVSTCQPLK